MSFADGERRTAGDREATGRRTFAAAIYIHGLNLYDCRDYIHKLPGYALRRGGGVAKNA